ncbi:MAG: FKBP-type peptidyl-prolyl cis-trans isomerase N-terminal domain-containing protein [Rouxiella aceris]|uniref:FKBP-type peptidyl-prolyl cis-trans isomerase N-terminal domain-containing protein n=1 Tax=Rouxiella aceris TaxID=2703884 RepID=UPI00283D2A3D|nr:FKBP-type peptidyl-prolyl cis-trans isomerase N-terminal domain-containing protein [Rouxiella aceris]MDR3433357.1 FKBP-type peptidyl-prolyl cis-trans isomerase N-terminal domain-containing protein [Rouxiella aceris]
MERKTLALVMALLLSGNAAQAAEAQASAQEIDAEVSSLLTQSHQVFLDSLGSAEIATKKNVAPRVQSSNAQSANRDYLTEISALKKQRAELQKQIDAQGKKSRSSIDALSAQLAQLQQSASKSPPRPTSCLPPPATEPINKILATFLSNLGKWNLQQDQHASQEKIGQLTREIDEVRGKLAAADKSLKARQTAVPASVLAAKPRTKPESSAQKQAYANGIMFANQLNEIARQQQQIGLTLDPESLLNGLQDGLVHKSILSDGEIGKALNEFKQQTDKKLAALAKQSTQNSDNFLKEFARQKGVRQHPSGFSYKIAAAGKKDKAKAGNQLRISLKESLSNHVVVSDTAKQGGPVTLYLDELPPPLQEGVKMLGAGGKIKIVLPASKIYTQETAPPLVPLKSVLVYDINLIGIVGS